MILNEKIKSKSSSYYESKTMFFSFLEECFSKHNLEINIKKYDINKEDFNGLSVCIPCFNDSESVENSIKSVLIDDVKNIYVMLMTDTNENLVNIKEHLESLDNRIKCFISEKKVPAVARNELFKNVTTSHVLFLDADDYFKDGSLKILIEESKTQDADCLIFPYQVFIASDFIRRFVLQTTCIMQSSFFRISGKFDERYKDGGEDPGLYFDKEIKIVDSSILIRKDKKNGFGKHSCDANSCLDIIKFNKNIFYDYFKNFINYEDITNFEYCQIRNILRYLDYDKFINDTTLFTIKNDEYCKVLLSAFFYVPKWHTYADYVILNKKLKLPTLNCTVSKEYNNIKDNKLSIIIPCWKNSDTIIDCVTSCNIEEIDKIFVLLMDSKSIELKDKIKNINKDKIFVYTNKRLSLPEARNYLIDKVDTEWVTNIDGDETLNSYNLVYLKNHKKEYNICFTSNNVTEEDIFIKDLKLLMNADSPNVFAKTELMKKFKYDENTYIGFEDLEFNIRVSLSEKCAYTNACLIKNYKPAHEGMYYTSILNNAIMYIVNKNKKLYSDLGVYDNIFDEIKI